MKPRLDLSALVIGIVLIGFALSSLPVLAGSTVPGPAALPYALTLIVAGVVGLVISSTSNKPTR